MNEVDCDTLADRCRQHDPDRFAVLCRMHLLFLLDLNFHEFDSNLPESLKTISLVDNSDRESTLSSSKLMRNLAATVLHRPRQRNADAAVDLYTTTASKPNSGKASLSMKCVEGLYQLMDFLSEDSNLLQEGIFRKSGKKSRQQELYGIICEGEPLDLNIGGPYNAHDCASVLKGFLADLSEPLLTEAHYAVHCQIAGLHKDNKGEASNRRLEALQLIFLLLPIENRNLLRRLLILLHRVSQACSVNRMNAVNLATMFVPHILCPRKMIAEELRHKSCDLTAAVAFMIENVPQLFLLPPALIRDLKVFKDVDSDQAVKTMLTFCERRKPQKIELEFGQCAGVVNDTTAVALAELYAHVQSMPESMKKRQFIKQFNKENKKLTPAIATSEVQPLKLNHHRSKSLRRSLKTRLFGKNKRHQTANPICLKDTIEQDKRRATEMTDQVETIKHPAYCQNSTSLEILRAAVAKRQNMRQQSVDQSNSIESLVVHRQPSSSSLVFHTGSARLSEHQVINSMHNSQSHLNRKSNLRALRKASIFKETAL